MAARLLTVRTFHPSSSYPQSYIHQQMKLLLSNYDKTNYYQSTLDSMFNNSSIDKRHFFLPVDGDLYKKQIESPSVERMLNNLIPQVVPFLRSAIKQVLSDHNINPNQIDGYIGTADIPLSPPINLRAVENLGFRSDIQYLFPLYHGCIAGLSSMELACNIIKLKPNAAVLTSNIVISSRFYHGVLQGQFQRLFGNGYNNINNSKLINNNNNNDINNINENNNEAITNTTNNNNSPIANLDSEIKNDLMASTIFGDGVAVSLLVGPEHPLYNTPIDSLGRRTPHIIENQGRYLDGTQCHVAQDLLDHGWRSIVTRQVKDLGPLFLSQGLDEFLRTIKLSPSEINNWCLHPGGPKVLKGLLTHKQFGLTNNDIRLSWKSFKEYGNCGGVSVLNVMEQTWEENNNNNNINNNNSINNNDQNNNNNNITTTTHTNNTIKTITNNTKSGNNAIAMAIGPGMRTQAMHLRHQ